jgi:predicted TIM-barrel fold metal-dependent hydrolase
LRRLHGEFRINGMGEFAPHFFGFPPNDRERCYPIYEACEELGLHIAPNCSIISSSISRFCDPIYFEDVAQDFPGVNVCLTSAGLPHWTETAIALAQSKVNVYLDVGDWQTRYTKDPIDAVLRFVRRALDSDARHKILFGSDHPVYTRTVSEKTWVGVFTEEATRRGMPFSDDDLHLLFSENPQEYLNLDLPARGARS